MATTKNVGDLDLGVMVIDDKETVNNIDCLGLLAAVDRALVECSQCPSARRPNLHEQDVKNMEQIARDWRRRYELAKGIPDLYMPNYDPKPLAVPKAPQVNRVPNPDLQHMLNMLSACRTQLLFGVSGKQSSGFHANEAEATFDPWINKLDAHIAQARNVNVGPDADPMWMPDLDNAETGTNPGTPR